jgi:hypothetical protein
VLIARKLHDGSRSQTRATSEFTQISSSGYLLVVQVTATRMMFQFGEPDNGGRLENRAPGCIRL